MPIYLKVNIALNIQTSVKKKVHLSFLKSLIDVGGVDDVDVFTAVYSSTSSTPFIIYSSPQEPSENASL